MMFLRGPDAPAVAAARWPGRADLAGWRRRQIVASSLKRSVRTGDPEIVVDLGDPMRGQSRYLLVGQMDAPLSVVATGRVAMVGARLTPSGLYRLLPLSQDRLARQVLSLDSRVAHLDAPDRRSDCLGALGRAHSSTRSSAALEGLVPRQLRSRPTAWSGALSAAAGIGRQLRA